MNLKPKIVKMRQAYFFFAFLAMKMIKKVIATPNNVHQIIMLNLIYCTKVWRK